MFMDESDICVCVVCRAIGSDVDGTSPLIKHRSSTKATPTSTMTTAQTIVTPIVTAGDPCVPAAPEVKGHVQEGVKGDGQLVRGHVGVRVIGGDMLMEIRAKQEKRKKVRHTHTS